MKNLVYGLKLFLFLSLALAAEAIEPIDISSELEAMLKDSSIPSLAAIAVVDEEIVSLGASGIRKKGASKKVTVKDKYHIGSCTKSMTATLAAMLVEQGKLSWETKPSEVFPEIDMHAGYRDLTLMQLLTNTGGVPGEIEPRFWSELWQAKGRPPAQRLKLVKEILSKPPAYKPGTKSEYSNSGFAIAGAMLEKVTGKAYEDLLARMLFAPLGMKSAGFRAPARNGRVDQPYGHITKASEVVPVNPEPSGDNPAAIAPAGAVHCSIADFAKYAQFHMGVIGNNLISQESLEILHAASQAGGYAMGWIVTDRDWAGGKALTHAGSNTMFYAVIWIAPKKRFAAIAMCNYGGKEASSKCDEIIASLVRKHLE